MTDVIGTARIDIEVNIDKATSNIKGARSAFSEFATDAQKQMQGMDGASKRVVSSLDRQIDKVGKTREEWLRHNIVTRTSGAVQADLLKKLTQNEAKLLDSSIAFNKYGISAKQNAAALRMVPAQLSDIFISLQGGQKPLTVLLQQGSQLKDSFGGIAPAVSALGGSLLGIINPITVTAAAAGALAFAWKQGADELHKFDVALLSTGNYAGLSRDKLRQLVDQFDALSGVARGGAVEALTAVAASGRFTGKQFDMVAEAAARMQTATGQSVDSTISKFSEIGKSPVSALLKLNETEHFLTETQLRRIQALQDEGREQEAVAESMRIYSTHLSDVATKAEASLPAISRWWREIKDETSSAWGEVGTYITLVERAAKLRLPGMGGGAGDAGFLQQFGTALLPSTRLRMLNDHARRQLEEAAGTAGYQTSSGSRGNGRIVNSAKEKQEAEDKKKAQEEVNRWNDQNLSKQQKQLAEEEKIVAAYAVLGKKRTDTEVQAALAASKARFAEAEARSAPKGTKTNPANAIIDRLQKQIALTDAQGLADEKLTTVQKMRLDIEVELARLGTKVGGADKAAITDLLKKAEASEAVALARQQEVKANEALARQQAMFDQKSENSRMANEASLMGIGRGGDAIDMLNRQIAIQREYADELKRLGDRGVAEDKANWDKMAANARVFRDSELERERKHQQDMLAAKGDWKNGARKAMDDYSAHASDVAGRTGDLFASNFQRAEDAIVQFATTGKLSIKGLLADIGTELVRFFAKQAVMQFIQAFASSWMSGTTGVGANASSAQSGGSFVGPRAKGGAFHGATEFFAKGGAFTNSIVNQATPFAFANGGKFGVMGEAGPEAIMPLERDSRGRLGVIASGGGSGGMSFQQHITINSDGSSKSETSASEQNAAAKEFGNRMRAVAQEEIMRAMRDGGALRRAGVGA